MVAVNGKLSETETCDCPQPCTDTVHQVEMSTMDYPSPFFGEYWQQQFGVGTQWLKYVAWKCYFMQKVSPRT